MRQQAGESKMFEDERNSTAALIAADPAFTSLEASGAPILAVMGTPPRVVYANAAATAVFGADPAARLLSGGERGLAAAIDRLRGSGAPRLERLSIDLGAGAQTITILCRRLFESDDAPCFAVAALGLRADDAAPRAPAPGGSPEPPAPKAEAEETPADPALAELRARLAERHGEAAPRFLWKTDAAGRFVDVTHVLGDVVGARYADLLGRGVEETSNEMGLGPAFAAALATRKSWSGVLVDWPVEAPACHVPTTLGALPIYDAGRDFSGFQGFGVLRLSLATPIAMPDAAPEITSPETVEMEAEPQTPPPREPEFSGANVVPLRPAPAPEPASALTPVEQNAFDEIGRALVESAEPGDARDLLGQVTRAIENPPAAADDAASRAMAMVDLLPVGVLVARGTNALYANRTLLDYLGYTDLDALAADGGLARVFLGRLPARAPAASPVEVKAQDGETLDVDVHVQSIDWSGGPATLISLRRARANAHTRAENARLRAQETELTRLGEERDALAACFDGAGEPTAILGADGRIERVNAEFAALLGEDARVVAGRDLASLFRDEDAMRLKAFFAPGNSEAAEETVFAVKARRAGVARTKLSLRPLGPGRFIARALAEPAPAMPKSDSEAAREEAERASAAKSDFLARVSHEIRTPLNAIIGFAEVMMEERFGPVGNERYKEYLKDVHTSGTHVLSIVNDLLDLSKIEAGKMELAPEDLDANATIGECVSIMQTQANQQRVIVRLSLAPRLPRIRADERSLRQILLNLLSNAVKFNEPGGQVIVSSAQTDAGFVVIRVKDTGIGMSDDEIDIALEPFRQVATSRKTTGTGLGLPVTKALIEANHASFTIKSRKNEGTLIEVAFPPARSLAAE
jgi:signal transduction histidine kinase